MLTSSSCLACAEASIQGLKAPLALVHERDPVAGERVYHGLLVEGDPKAEGWVAPRGVSSAPRAPDVRPKTGRLSQPSARARSPGSGTA